MITKKKKERKGKGEGRNIHCITMFVSNLFYQVTNYLMLIFIWCKQTFPYLHFCYGSAERWLSECYKGKRKEIIVCRLLKGQHRIKMRQLHFSLQQEPATFVMSEMKKSPIKCQNIPGMNDSVSQLYGSVVPRGPLAFFGLCVWLNY